MMDHVEDVRRYVPEADPVTVAALVEYLGRDGGDTDRRHVAMSRPEERQRVCESFLRGKCKVDASDAELEAAVHAVGEIMKGDRNPLRSTFYYLLATRFDRLHLFGG